ncbi:MAG: tetratricopeptide repeat protein [Planctomycetaceae bacterium]
MQTSSPAAPERESRTGTLSAFGTEPIVAGNYGESGPQTQAEPASHEQLPEGPVATKFHFRSAWIFPTLCGFSDGVCGLATPALGLSTRFSRHRSFFVSARSQCITGLLLLIPISGCSWLQRSSSSQAVECERLQDQAQRAERSGDLGEAILLLSQAVHVNPQDAEAHQRLGQLMFAQGQRAEALRHLKYAASLITDDALGWIRLARAQLACQESRVAAESLERALKLEPQNVSALLMSAAVEQQMQRDHVALELFHRVLAVAPQSTEALTQAAQIHLKLRQADSAAPLLRSVLQKNDLGTTQTNDTRWMLGIAYGAQKRWPDAIESLKPPLSSPQYHSANDWYRLAYAAYQAQDRRQTTHALQRALALETEHEPSLRLATALTVKRTDVPTTVANPLIVAGPANTGAIRPASGQRNSVPFVVPLIVPPGW